MQAEMTLETRQQSVRIPQQSRRTLQADVADALYLIAIECINCGDMHAYEFAPWLMAIVSRNEGLYS